jgi:tripartite-type tricarboxylate transporter receptor subunit TctC
MRADAPYKTIDDIIKAKEPPKCGSTGVGSAGYVLDRVLELALGAKINTVMGYPGGNEIDLAVEKGEIHCRAMTIESYFAREPFHTWRKKGFVRVLVQTGKKRDPRMADVPTVYELMDEYKTPQATRRLATLVLAAGEFGRPFVATPGVPSDRVKILREAFSKTLGDADVVADVKKKKLELDPTSGEELETLAKEVITSDRETIDRMKNLLGK